MNMNDLMNGEVRKQLIDEINSGENLCRKRRSLGDYEVYNDRAFRYVRDRLVCQLGEKTVLQMPIVSNLNIAKRMVTERATIYNTPPARSYEDITDQDRKALELVYSESGFDTVFGKADKYYCLRNQSFLQVIPQDRKLWLRVLQNHNVDVIPRDDNPEKAFAYIISSFDKTGLITSDGTNQKIADPDDGKKKFQRYQVWTDEVVFTMDGEGVILQDTFMVNELGMLPFVDLSKDKDLQFFVQLGQALTDFTVDFNVAWSDLMYTSRLQNFSVGVVSGDPALKPSEMTVGVNKWLWLPNNPNNPQSKLEFEFMSPSPQIEAALKTLESLVTTFLSTQGLDTSSVQVTNSGGAGFSSALERLIAMIEQYVATKDDFDLFKVVEKEVHKIVVNYLSLLTGNSDLLDPRYFVSAGIKDSSLTVTFHEPEMVETPKEKLENGKTEIDLGLQDQVGLYAKLHGVPLEQAEQEILAIQERKFKLEAERKKLMAKYGVEEPATAAADGTQGDGKPGPNETDKGEASDNQAAVGGDGGNNQA